MIDYLVSFLSRYLYAIIIITISTLIVLIGIRFVNTRAYKKRTALFLSSLFISFLITLAVLILCFAHWYNVGFWQLYHIICDYVTLSLTHTVCTAFILLIGGSFSFAFLRGITNYYLCENIITRLYSINKLERQNANRQYKILEKLSKAAGMKDPKIGLIDSGRPSIFSFGRKERSIIVLSVGLLETLSDREMEAAFAHEIAHIKNKDCLIKAVSSSFKFAVPFNFLNFIVEPALSREREFNADTESVKITNKPRALISTLMKLQQSFSTSSRSRFLPRILLGHLVLSSSKLAVFNHHPSVSERIRNLREIERGLKLKNDIKSERQQMMRTLSLQLTHGAR